MAALSAKPSTSSDTRVSIAEELSSLINEVEYESTVCFLPDSWAMDIKAFDGSSLADQYWLDTRHCVTKRKRYNRKNLYCIFGEISNSSADDVKQMVIDEIHSHKEWYSRAGIVCLGMRGIKFADWLKKLEKPRTIPDELVLHALSVVYRRHVLVHTSIRPWTTVKRSRSMTLGVISEICETVLLYIGNGMFGILHRRPFTADQPPAVDLSSIQYKRPIHRTIDNQQMFMYITRDCNFETTITEDEIESLEPPKPEATLPVSIFDNNFVTSVKTEPEEERIIRIDPTNRVIGELLLHPESITKELKQELIDATTVSILDKHSAHCELSQFVQQSSRSTIRIEDVRSIIYADNATLNAPVDTLQEHPNVAPIKQEVTWEQDTLEDHSSLRASTADTTVAEDLDEQASLYVETHSPSLCVVTPDTTVEGSTDKPSSLCVETHSRETRVEMCEFQTGSLCEATSSATPTEEPNMDPTNNTSSDTLPLAQSSPARASIAQNISAASYDDDASEIIIYNPPTILDETTTAGTPSLRVATPAQKISAASYDDDTSETIIYDPPTILDETTTAGTPSLRVATPEHSSSNTKVNSSSWIETDTCNLSADSTLNQPDIVHQFPPSQTLLSGEISHSVNTTVTSITHKEIMDRTVSVSLEILDEERILTMCGNTTPVADDVNPEFCPIPLNVSLTRIDEPHTTSDSQKQLDNTDIDLEYPLKKPRPGKIRPLRKPSSARIAAQEMIKFNRKSKQKPRLTRTYVLRPRVSKTIDSTLADERELDQVETIGANNSPPATPKRSPPAKVATFRYRSYGLKYHKDEKLQRKVKNRSFRCDLCGERFGTVKCINKHYRTTHEELKCKDCMKLFNNPLSLKKHEYEHKSKNFTCDSCTMTFPFKSQRDDHSKKHLKDNRFYCKEPNCKSSFSRERDLKKHIKEHNSPPISCDHCDYKHVDIRNVRQHMRTHTDEKPYSCAKCNRNFKFSTQRLRHKCPNEEK